MSLQVGSSCYASAVDAGRAACSQFQTIATINGNILKTVSCSSSDISTGALVLDVVTTDTTTAVTSTVQVNQLVTFPPCVEGDYIVAAEIIAGALLALWVIGYSGHKLIQFLSTNRGDYV